jgi:hypothetical protein
VIDTKEKRRMALDFAKIRGTGMPVPSGMTSISERAHILNLYFEVSVAPLTFFWRNKNRVMGAWQSKTSPATAWQSKKSPTTAWKGRVTPQDGSTQEI